MPGALVPALTSMTQRPAGLIGAGRGRTRGPAMMTDLGLGHLPNCRHRRVGRGVAGRSPRIVSWRVEAPTPVRRLHGRISQTCGSGSRQRSPPTAAACEIPIRCSIAAAINGK